MSAPFLADALGPRARRRVLWMSLAAAVAVAAVVAVAVQRLAENDQLTAERWSPFSEWLVWRYLLIGLWNTLKAAATGMVIALVVGAVMALARLARNAPVRWLAGVYVEFFRGFPLLLLILFSVYGLRAQGFDISTYWALVLALAVYNSSVLAEIFRAGILSLDRGQSEAASAIGLRYWQGMRLVLLPQAVRRMVPAIVSQMVVLLKDTSLGFVVQYDELLRRGQLAGQFDGNLLQSLFVVAGVFIVVNLALSRVARRLELRQRRRYGGGVRVGVGEDLALLGNEGAGGPDQPGEELGARSGDGRREAPEPARRPTGPRAR